MARALPRWKAMATEEWTALTSFSCVGLCWLVLTCVDLCWLVLTCVDVCWLVLDNFDCSYAYHCEFEITVQLCDVVSSRSRFGANYGSPRIINGTSENG